MKYGAALNDKGKKLINFKKLLIKYSSLNQDLLSYLDELLDLEVINMIMLRESFKM